MQSVRDTAARITDIFPGAGEMAVRCRAFAWAATSLGAAADWSQSLRTTVSTMLTTRHPMFLWWGPDFVQIYNDGYRPSFGDGGRHPRALGMRGRDFWTDIWDVIGPEVEGVLASGEATWHEDNLVPIERNGHLEAVYWTYSYSPVRDDDGSIGGVLVVVQETTGRVVAEQRLAALNRELEIERARLVEVFRQAPAFLAVLRGPSHAFELVNDAYYQLVGHRELLGKPVREALPEVIEQGFIARLDDVLATGTRFVGLEVPVVLARTPDAPLEERFVDFVYQPLVEADGTRSGIMAHGSDVTVQVRARREVERLLAESDEARHAIAKANQQLEEQQLALERTNQHLQNSTAKLEAANGELQLTSARLEEQTEDAEQAREAAEAANRTKSDFLAAMSHELRTPLNAIAGYAQLLELGVHGSVTDAQRQALGRIQTSQQHLLALINDILNFAKLEAGRVEYRVEAVPLAEVVADVLTMIEPQLVATGLTYESRVTPDMVARADREKLTQVLLNLLSNALKFTDCGGQVIVDLGARAASPAGVVFLRVSDTGVGIPREKQEAIFDPFVQVHRNLTRSTEGTGLGLAISRDLARGMGGDLRVRSVEGEGSTFTLTLPAA